MIRNEGIAHDPDKLHDYLGVCERPKGIPMKLTVVLGFAAVLARAATASA
jgi:hypothetical protein